MATELRDKLARDKVNYSAQSPSVFLRHAGKAYADHAVT